MGGNWKGYGYSQTLHGSKSNKTQRQYQQKKKKKVKVLEKWGGRDVGIGGDG